MTTLPLWHIDAVIGGGVHPIAYVVQQVAAPQSISHPTRNNASKQNFTAYYLPLDARLTATPVAPPLSTIALKLLQMAHKTLDG
ncbi:hypothetical protein PT2222_410010 [Paraburkholderia tropica]